MLRAGARLVAIHICSGLPSQSGLPKRGISDFRERNRLFGSAAAFGPLRGSLPDGHGHGPRMLVGPQGRKSENVITVTQTLVLRNAFKRLQFQLFVGSAVFSYFVTWIRSSFCLWSLYWFIVICFLFFLLVSVFLSSSHVKSRLSVCFYGGPRLVPPPRAIFSKEETASQDRKFW